MRPPNLEIFLRFNSFMNEVFIIQKLVHWFAFLENPIMQELTICWFLTLVH